MYEEAKILVLIILQISQSVWKNFGVLLRLLFFFFFFFFDAHVFFSKFSYDKYSKGCTLLE